MYGLSKTQTLGGVIDSSIFNHWCKVGCSARPDSEEESFALLNGLRNWMQVTQPITTFLSLH